MRLHHDRFWSIPMLVSWEWYIYPPTMTVNPPQIPQISEDHINPPKKSSFQNHQTISKIGTSCNRPQRNVASKVQQRRLRDGHLNNCLVELARKKRETPGLLGDLTPIMISCRTFWLLNQTHVALVKGISQRVQKLRLLKNMLDYFSDLLRPKTAKV